MGEWKKNRNLLEDDKYLYQPRMSATEENEKKISVVLSSRYLILCIPNCFEVNFHDLKYLLCGSHCKHYGCQRNDLPEARRVNSD